MYHEGSRFSVSPRKSVEHPKSKTLEDLSSLYQPHNKYSYYYFYFPPDQTVFGRLHLSRERGIELIVH